MHLLLFLIKQNSRIHRTHAGINTPKMIATFVSSIKFSLCKDSLHFGKKILDNQTCSKSIAILQFAPENVSYINIRQACYTNNIFFIVLIFSGIPIPHMVLIAIMRIDIQFVLDKNDLVQNFPGYFKGITYFLFLKVKLH